MRKHQRWLLHLYPRGWRGRYEEEFVALLEACPFSLWTIWDVCLGAIDAHLHLETLNGRMMPFMNRLRTTSVIVFCAYIGFVVAGLGFGKLVEYDDFMYLRDHNAGVGAAYYTLYAGAFIALAAVLVGGLPLAFAAARDAIARKRWRLLALFAVPPVTLALWLAYIFIAEALDPHPTPILARPFLDRIIGIGLFGGLFVLAAILSTAAVCMIVIRSDISEKLFHFARIPAIITALAMILMLLAVAGYGLAINAADPELLAENQGLLATNTTLSLGVILGMMAVATVVAIAALIRGRGAGASAKRAPTSTIASQPAS